MALPSILHQDKNSSTTFARESDAGFTLIEIMVAIAILAIILTLGLFISFDFYKSYSFRAEKNIIISVLQKARNQSLTNINQVRHGVHFEDIAGLKYIIFECPAGTPQCTRYTASATDNIINSSWGIFITSPPLPFDVIFDQLNGASIDNTITIGDGVKSYTISINSEGRIDW